MIDKETAEYILKHVKELMIEMRGGSKALIKILGEKDNEDYNPMMFKQPNETIDDQLKDDTNKDEVTMYPDPVTKLISMNNIGDITKYKNKCLIRYGAREFLIDENIESFCERLRIEFIR